MEFTQTQKRELAKLLGIGPGLVDVHADGIASVIAAIRDVNAEVWQRWRAADEVRRKALRHAKALEKIFSDAGPWASELALQAARIRKAVEPVKRRGRPAGRLHTTPAGIDAVAFLYRQITGRSISASRRDPFYRVVQIVLDYKDPRALIATYIQGQK